MYNEWNYSSNTLRVSVIFLLVSSFCVIIGFSTPHWLDASPAHKFVNLGKTNLHSLRGYREGKKG